MPDLKQCNGLPVHVYKAPDLLPALAIASSVFLAEGIIPDYQSFIHVLEEKGGCTVLNPNPDAVKAYEPVYRKYKTIYLWCVNFIMRCELDMHIYQSAGEGASVHVPSLHLNIPLPVLPIYLHLAS